MKNIERKIWREKWLYCINQLTSYDLQKISWLDKVQTNPYWSFIEFKCSYFDNLSIDHNYKEFLESGSVTIQEFDIIRDWHESLDKYNSPNNDDYDNAAVLNDEKWIKILQKGVDAKVKLAKILSDNEKQFLTDKINYLK